MSPWDEDTAADRYQQAHDRAAQEDIVEGWQPRTAWVTPGEPVCPKCSYLVVDGRCVKGCTHE